MTQPSNVHGPRFTAEEKPTPAFSVQLPEAQGFSLVEVVIAIGILSIGLFGAIKVFPVGLRASQRAERLSRAALVGQRTMESYKLKHWDELEAGQTTSSEDPFEVTISIDQPDVEGVVDPSRLKRLSVTVTWTQDGRERSVTTTTYRNHPSG